MKQPLLNVAIFIETRRAYGRQLLEGIGRFNREQNNWSITYTPYDFNHSVPKFLSSWKGDGIITRVNHEEMLKALSTRRVIFRGF